MVGYFPKVQIFPTGKCSAWAENFPILKFPTTIFMLQLKFHVNMLFYTGMSSNAATIRVWTPVTNEYNLLAINLYEVDI